MIRWIDDAPVRWLDEGGQLGQTPAQEATVKQGFSNAEKILLASVAISGIGLVIHLWELFGRKPNAPGT